MTELVTALSPLLLASVAVPLPASELLAHCQWVHVWLPTLGLLGMGLRDVFGGGEADDDDDGGSGSDPLGDGFGENLEAEGYGDRLGDEAEGEGFGDGLGDEAEPFDDVEPRIDDLEADLEELESTVSAVNADHESVKESLEDIQDNVRKLLEVYEVVTQGMNPFADDAPATGGAAGGASAFGLLEGDDAGSEADPAEDLFGDEDDAGSEADAAESLFEDDAEGQADAAEGLFEDDEAGSDADAVEALIEDAVDDEEGVTFDELKSEFEFGGDRPADDVEDTADGGSAADDESFDAGPSEPAGPEKPYLEVLPSGFGAELLVMEWLDFLVSSSSVADAFQAIRYYGTVEWISEEVAAHLQSVLSGMSPPRALAATDGGRPTELSVDHHAESLEYISQLRALDGEAGSLRESPGHRVGDRGHRQEGHGVQR